MNVHKAAEVRRSAELMREASNIKCVKSDALAMLGVVLLAVKGCMQVSWMCTPLCCAQSHTKVTNRGLKTAS